MRPNGLESIRAVQSALSEIITPELTSAFAQDAAQTLQLLLESLAGEWDDAADWLRRDNVALAGLLSASREAMMRLTGSNERLAAIVSEIESRQGEDDDDSLLLSRLSLRNNLLLATLERIVVAFEDITGEPGYEEIEDVRHLIYAHLKRVAASGWSFWDVSSFRGRMAAGHTSLVGGDGQALLE